jgi:type IV pilus assembly protein PilM
VGWGDDEEDVAVALPDLLNPAGLARKLQLGKLQNLLGANLSNPFKRTGGYLVVDIGSSSIKLAEVFHGGSGPRITALAQAPLPPTVIQSNVIQDEAPVVDAIKALIQRTGVQSKAAITAVPGPAVIVKKVVLPAQTGNAVDAAVLAEAQQLIPDSLDNVHLDYQVVDWMEDGNKMEVLVVAVKREIINSYTAAIRAAGLDPAVVDVDYFALENMFELNYDAEGGSVALVNIGARYSSINILKDGRSTFTGDVPVGGAEFTDALVRQLGVSPNDADALKRGRGAANIAPADAEPILGSVTEFIVEEVQRALSFFWTAATDEPLGAVLLSGGPSRMPGLSTQLKERLDTNVEVVDPFRRVTLDGRVDRALIEESGPALAVIVGLATRRPGDK